MATDAVDIASKELKRAVPNSVTDKLPIVGADGYLALMQQIPALQSESGLSAATIEHLLNRYGSLISEILELIASDVSLATSLHPSFPYIKAEILYAVTHEGAQSVDDVISRRTRLTFEAPENAETLVLQIADIIAPALGWNKNEKQLSIDEYMAIVHREREAVASLFEDKSAVNS